MLRIHFETPVHGWILVTFEDGEQILRLDVSHTPIDSLAPFAEIPLAFVERGEGIGRVHIEPGTYDIVLRKEGDQALLEVFELQHFGELSGRGTLVFKAQDTPQTLLLMWWRALRNLESRFDKVHWDFDFPTDAVKRLGLIAKAKAHKITCLCVVIPLPLPLCCYFRYTSS